MIVFAVILVLGFFFSPKFKGLIVKKVVWESEWESLPSEDAQFVKN